MEEKITNTDKAQGISPGRKRKLKWIVLIAILSILLISAMVVGGSFILPKNIKGAWELVVNPELGTATIDEISEGEKVYYVFDKPDRYGKGKWHTCYQSGVEYFEYELSEEGSVKKINLGTEDLEYKITGSKLLGNARLTIVLPEYTDETTGQKYEESQYVFEQAKDPQYDKKSYKDYETDSSLMSEKWTSNQRTLAYYFYYIPYVETVEFTDEGVMVIHYECEDLYLDRYMYFAYTAKDSELTFSLVTDMETKYTVSYEFDDNGNLKFKNDTTKDSLFADAFFGDFTFYTQENLPAPTEVAANDLYLTE